MNAPARHPSVDAEVLAAASWYEERCPGLGDQFLDALRTTIRAVQRNPSHFGIRFSDLRRANLERFPYAVWFVHRVEGVYILAVLHHKRDHRLFLRQRQFDP